MVVSKEIQNRGDEDVRSEGAVLPEDLPHLLSDEEEVEEGEIPRNTRTASEPSEEGSSVVEEVSNGADGVNDLNEQLSDSFESSTSGSSVEVESTSTFSTTGHEGQGETGTTNEGFTEQYLDYGYGINDGVVTGFENGFVPQMYQQLQPNHSSFIPMNPMGGIILPPHPAAAFQHRNNNQFQPGGGPGMICGGPIGINSPMMMPMSSPVPISNYVPFNPSVPMPGALHVFPSNNPPMQMMVPNVQMIPQQQPLQQYAVMPNMSSFPQLSPVPVKGINGMFPPQFHQQPMMCSPNGDYNFGPMVPFNQQQQYNQPFGGPAMIPAPAPWASYGPPADDMAFSNDGAIQPMPMPMVPYSWSNSSVDTGSCPSSPYASTDSDSSSGLFSFTSAEDSGSLPSTSMPSSSFMSKRQKFKRSMQSKAGQTGQSDKLTTFILDLTTTFIMNGEELPYVMSVLDRPMRFVRPPPNFDYYVPPAVADFDFFGGQHHMWQIKMEQFFGRFQPDVWRLQAVPDFQRNPSDGWIGFNITSKLRFCCRTCLTPWTSKQGKILFGFTKDLSSGRGWIFMKIFGQICMKKQRKQCQDWDYQLPACYPEEIERAVQKLSDYIGYRYYRIPIPCSIFEECRKSIRLATSRSNGSNTALPAIENHHRKDLCQACIQGVCRQKLSPTR